MNLKNGTIINQYKIISAIGKGGMGEVFLAQDTKLNRKVAIKFLNEEFSQDADKLNRFIQEAKAVSALNHPNILTVYEIGEKDEANFIVTEFIEGKTLREQLSPRLQISVRASVSFPRACSGDIYETVPITIPGFVRRGAGESGGWGEKLSVDSSSPLLPISLSPFLSISFANPKSKTLA